MRLVVLTDVHANLPALNAALSAIRRHGYDLLVHTGDAIGIGPFPAECLDRLLALPNCRLMMGNHDGWFAHGVPLPQPPWMSAGEWRHHQWTHAQIDSGLRPIVARWPYVSTETVASAPLTFLHYPVDANNAFLPIMPNPSTAELDAAFAPYAGALIFYGHHHPHADATGRARYLNAGSLGCAPTAIARYYQVDLTHDRWQVTHCAIPYDDVPLAQAYRVRRVPDAPLIAKVFHGGRFTC